MLQKRFELSYYRYLRVQLMVKKKTKSLSSRKTQVPLCNEFFKNSILRVKRDWKYLHNLGILNVTYGVSLMLLILSTLESRFLVTKDFAQQLKDKKMLASN